MSEAIEPNSFLESFANSFNSGRVDDLLSHYSKGAAYSPRPGVVVSGASLREALEIFLALQPKIAITLRKFLLSQDTALLIHDWVLSISTQDGQTSTSKGTATDVVCLDSDGKWRLTIDNPWGTAT